MRRRGLVTLNAQSSDREEQMSRKELEIFNGVGYMGS
ncbi:hypothetical protein QF026_002417 [Streptomyces aurantiacus]|nr:hypothetical protein [Streptomyces aurantiacus]